MLVSLLFGSGALCGELPVTYIIPNPLKNVQKKNTEEESLQFYKFVIQILDSVYGLKYMA